MRQSLTTVLIATGVAGLLLLCRWLLAREPDPFMRRIILLAFLAKLGGTFAFHAVLSNVYGGSGDTNRYFNAGGRLAPVIRGGTLPDQATDVGTPFMEFLAGAMFALLPHNRMLGNLVFSLLAFAGMLLFLQAFRLGVPDGDHRRYAVLILLLPTMGFWTSTLGKEAWMVFMLGASAYGAARVFRRKRFGYALIAVGGAGMFMMRPHMTALMAVSLAIAYVVRIRDKSVKQRGILWFAGLIIVVLGAIYVTENYSDEYLDDSAREESATSQVFARTADMTDRGGSAFDARPVRSPADLVHAMITVPFRPFLTEAHNRVAQIASLEGLALLALFVVSLPRLGALPRHLLRTPYLAFLVTYALGFIVAFSNVANFGILTRQRAQLLPFLVALVALPAAKDRFSRRSRGKGPPLVPAPTKSTADTPQPEARGDGHVEPEDPNAFVARSGIELVADLPEDSVRHS